MAHRQFQSIGTIEQGHAAGGITALAVETNIGHIKIEPGSDSGIQILAEVHVEETLAEQLAPANAERDLEVRQQDSRLLIANAHRQAEDSDDWRVDLTVRVPTLNALSLTTGVGELHADGNYERVRLETGVGDITSSGDIAQLTATTGVGSLQFSGSYEHAKINAGSGRILLTCEQLGSGRVTAGVGGLSISARKGPTGQLSCTTGTGSISLQLAEAWSGHFDLTAGLGRIQLPAKLASSHDESGPGATARGSHGTGTAELTLETGVGSITWQDQR